MLGHGTLALLAHALRGAGLSNDRRASKEAWGFTRTSPNFAARADTPCCPQHGGNGGGAGSPSQEPKGRGSPLPELSAGTYTRGGAGHSSPAGRGCGKPAKRHTPPSRTPGPSLEIPVILVKTPFSSDTGRGTPPPPPAPPSGPPRRTPRPPPAPPAAPRSAPPRQTGSAGRRGGVSRGVAAAGGRRRALSL